MKIITVTTLAIFLLSVNISFAQMTKSIQEYPAQAEDISPLLIGETIANMTLPDAQGNNIQIGGLFAEKPTILIFYRGGWCPYCNLQLSGLQEIEKELVSLGYQLVAVSTDKPENLRASIEKGKLTYALLSDADLSLAKATGIVFVAPKSYHNFLPESSGGKNKDMLLPVPSIFILNKKGEIRFEYIEPNFKERIPPNLLKAAASALKNNL